MEARKISPKPLSFECTRVYRVWVYILPKPQCLGLEKIYEITNTALRPNQDQISPQSRSDEAWVILRGNKSLGLYPVTTNKPNVITLSSILEMKLHILEILICIIISLQKSSGPKNYLHPPEFTNSPPHLQLPSSRTSHLLPRFLSNLPATVQSTAVHFYQINLFKQQIWSFHMPLNPTSTLNLSGFPLLLGRKLKPLVINTSPHG